MPRKPAQVPSPLLDPALALHRQGRLTEAAAIYRTILTRDPQNADARHLLGLVALSSGKVEAAVEMISLALGQRRDPAMLCNRGNALLRLGRCEEALTDADDAIGQRPDLRDAHELRGEILARLGQIDEACSAFDTAQRLRPRLETWIRRGEALYTAGRYADALASFTEAMLMTPGSGAALRGRGHSLYALGRFEDALQAYDAAISAEPAHALGHYNRGNVLRVLKRFEAAAASYEAATSADPGLAVARHNRALCLLHQGRLAEGFEAYEVRKQCPTFVDPRYQLDRTLGPGDDLMGRTLFIYPELFQGDLIQFGRFARTAQRRGARVKLAAPAAMHRLLQSLGSEIQLMPEDAVPERYDLQCALMSLPRAFGVTLERLPVETRYLEAEPDRVTDWRARIGGEGFRIGVIWQGSTAPYALPLQRSFPLTKLVPLASAPGVRLISLQKHHGLDQLDSLPSGLKVETLGEDFDPGPDAFVDTAAAMVACDLVVTPDTSVAHLAGALGVPTWVALPHVADWRWLDARDDCPWYPSVRLFRQTARNDWDGVFRAMATALTDRLSLASGR